VIHRVGQIIEIIIMVQARRHIQTPGALTAALTSQTNRACSGLKAEARRAPGRRTITIALSL